VPARRALDDTASLISLCIRQATDAGLCETATLLSIAHLDLVARLHGFTESELAAVAAMSDRDQTRGDE
jgi:hypothetical protein